jgi:Caspase domain
MVDSEVVQAFRRQIMKCNVRYVDICYRRQPIRNRLSTGRRLCLSVRSVPLLMCGLCIVMLAGCATINLQFSDLKEPAYSQYNNNIKFAIGKISNELGQKDEYKLNSYVSLDRPVVDVVREALINELYEEGYYVGESNLEISMDIFQISHTYTGHGLITKLNFVVKNNGLRVYEKNIEQRNQHRSIGDQDGYYNDIKNAIRAFTKDKEFEKFAFSQPKNNAVPTGTQETSRRKAQAITSDIDKLPLVKARQNRNAYAIVIGIEQYRQKLPRADFAVRDAQTVTDYLTKVMGYPEENVVTLTNDHATYVDLVKYLEKWLPNNVEQDSSVFVYYSGHGAPNPKTGDAYLVPYDGDPSFIDQTGYSLRRMYDTLGKLPTKHIIVALDSCFSGAGGRSVLAKGARPLVMTSQNTLALPANITVMTAASGEQVSSTYDEKGHGLFTYYMLKGIKNEDVIKQNGSIAIGNLFSYLKPQVERVARKQYNNEQTPQLMEPTGK